MVWEMGVRKRVGFGMRMLMDIRILSVLIIVAVVSSVVPKQLSAQSQNNQYEAILNSMAAKLCMRRQQYDCAVIAYRKSIKLSKEHDPSSLILADLYKNLGLTLLRQKDFSGALKVFENELGVRAIKLGRTHEDIPKLQNKIQDLELQLGIPTGPIHRFERIVEIYEIAYGKEHRRTVVAREDLELLKKKQE
jgi:tetratricopeptide (TPR) repeat protein